MSASNLSYRRPARTAVFLTSLVVRAGYAANPALYRNLPYDQKITHVPYKGSGAAITDVMSGQVPVSFMNVLQSLPLVKANRLRALGVTSPQRSPIAPDLPAIAEAGLPEFDMTNWYGLLLPSATPRDAVLRVQQEVSRILNLRSSDSAWARTG